MPPRPPPTPPVLTVLLSMAALITAWGSIALDQLARGLAGSAVGIPFQGVEISAAHRYTAVALQGAAPPLGPFSSVFVALAGGVAILVLALLVQLAVGSLRGYGWLRGLSLAWVVVAFLWIPVALLSSVLPRAGGPVTELYGKLGAPLAGRWTAAVLGLVLMALAAGAISRLAVSAGRRWMRADGVDFRRRLVRVTAGWPGVTATAALAFAASWAPTAWVALVAVAVLASLHYRTT